MLPCGRKEPPPSAHELNKSRGIAMRIAISEASDLIFKVLTRHGLSSQHARIVEAHIVDSMLIGREFLGLARLLTMIELLRQKGPPGSIEIVRENDVSASIDGGDNVGYVTSLVGIDKAVSLARKGGIGVVTVNNTWNSGRLGYYVERAARCGLIAFHTLNTTACVAPAGGLRAVFGTNPLAFAVPTSSDPIIIDFGTSAVTAGEVALRSETGVPLEEGWAIDGQGRPTLDAAQALAGAILPWGGHRGFSLALMAQILGIMSGGKPVIDGVGGFGMFFLVIDPGHFHSQVEFQERLAVLLRAIDQSSLAATGRPTRLPGQESAARRRAALAAGTIDVNAIMYTRIRDLAAKR